MDVKKRELVSTLVYLPLVMFTLLRLVYNVGSKVITIKLIGISYLLSLPAAGAATTQTITITGKLIYSLVSKKSSNQLGIAHPCSSSFGFQPNDDTSEIRN